MPAQAAELDEALKKKGGLTLTQLANYDDIVTDALVDRVYYWAKIRKVRANARPSRGVREEDICKILQHDVIINKDAASAQKKILAQSGMVSYMRSLATTDEKEHFERHLRKYIQIYLPDCPFEVCTTQRYTIMTAEACVIARKPIKAGDPIKYLSGIQVEMSEKEEKALSSRTDFSIVLSSRRKRPSLFLGPARFANHDCDSTARLTTTGPHGIHIVACKNIAVGEEITVKYGLDYFGEDNCECLCSTCERLTRNGWDPRGPLLHEDSSDDDTEEEEEPPRKRQWVQKTPQIQAPSASTTAANNGASSSRQQVIHNSTSLGGPRKRGRPRKRPIAEESVDEKYTQSARDFLAAWFRARPKLAAYFGYQGPSDDELQRQMDALIPKTSHQRGSLDQQQLENAFGNMPKHYTLLDRVLSMYAEKGEEEIREFEAKIKNLNDGTAALLGIATDKVPDYYAQSDNDEPVPLPTPPRDLEAHQCKQESEDDAEADVQLTTPPSTVSTVRHLTPESNVETAQSRNHLPRPDPKGARLSSVKKQRTGSSLRHVINAEETTGAGDPFSVPASPVPMLPPQPDLSPPKRKRGRPRKHPLPVPTSVPTEAETNVATEAVQAPTSTDESSMSSIFSTESATGQVSPVSSVDELDTFAAGSICQNIVDLYTSGAPGDVEEDVDMAETIQEQLRASRSVGNDETPSSEHINGKRRTRRSTQQAGSATPLDTVQSIEQHAESPTKSRTKRAKGPSSREDDDDDDESESEERRGPPRTPGDYHLTSTLLVDTHCRWVECRNCDQFFVQHDAYQTRIACPRCERHSKLYGFYWPKTDKSGRDDRDERVLDHREINRFIEPDEERSERKGRKTLLEVLRDREVSERDSLEVEARESGSGRGSREESGSRRRSSRRLV